MFGHDSQPTRIYSYGARRPAEMEAVDAQMVAAHRYRNVLVEIERKRRAAVEALLSELCPRLGEVAKALAAEDERMKVSEGDALAAAKAARKTLWAERKALRAALFADPRFKQRQDALDAEDGRLRKDAREKCGLYWGTYLQVEQSMGSARSGAPPRFARWDGSGHLAVQIQRGMTVKALFDGCDSRLRITRGVAPVDGAKRQLTASKWRTCHFRVGSDANREPVWATVPFALHRPMPDDAKIKWAHLVRRRIGTKCEWRLQFTLAREAGWEKEDRADSGAVGVDVGWRARTDGSLRVAYWAGGDGGEGEVVLDAGWVGQMRKTEDIQAIRDDLFNGAKDALAGQVKAMSAPPEWLRDDVATLHAWKSKGRLAGLVWRWRANRFDGDRGLFALLEAWRKRDLHLCEYERNLRDQLQSQRLDFYRKVAASLRRRYRTIGLRADVSLEKIQSDGEGRAKLHQRDACISSLRQALANTGAVVEVKAGRATTTCSTCGAECERGDAAALFLKCSRCGEVHDGDRNAAINILRAAGGKWSGVAVGAGRSK